MTRGLRRTLVFLAMVVAGLLVVVLLADPFQRRRTAPVEEPSPSDAGRLKVRDSEQRETQMAFGAVSFDVLPEDAGSDSKPLYRVRIASGQPDASGAFLAEKPVITLLDADTGQPTGELSADRAQFEVGSSVGRTVTIELGRMRVDNSQLSGNVRGRFTAPDGTVATLACENLRIRDELVEAPGLVTWGREDVSVSGYDMQWDGTVGRIVFASGARLVLPPLGDRPGFDLLAPGGMTLDIPPEAPDARAAAHAELRGRVVGSSSDGRSLEADLLVLDGPAGTVTLTGDAALEGEAPGSAPGSVSGGERARLTAQQIVVTTDDAGALSRADAEGDVRLTAKASSAWIAADSLHLENSIATAPGRVTWSREPLMGAGTGLNWDLEHGRLELLQQTELSVAEQADHPLAGLHVVTPGGLRWELAAGTGELSGPVHGSMPDGTSFDADRLVESGADKGLRLEGHAVVVRKSATLHSRLSADRITAVGEGDGSTRLQAEGDVELVSGAPDATPSRLVAQQLQAREGRLQCEGPVSWTRAGLSVEGDDLDWNEAEGRLELARVERITLVDAARALDVEARAEGGLSWVVPPDAKDPVAEGRGELRGRVTGRSADGDELEADRVLVDGPAGTLTLLGDARVATQGATGGGTPLQLRSDELAITGIDGEPRVEAAGPVQWEVGALAGKSIGLDWNSATGHLRLQRQVELTLAAAADKPDAATWTVTADGSLDWQSPPEAQAPMEAGRIELSGDVRGRSDHGQAFQTSSLVVDGARDEVSLLGPSSFEHESAAGHVSLQAQRSITLLAADDGASDRLVAEGDVLTTLVPPDGGTPLELAGRRLTLDGRYRTLILEGPVSATHGADEERLGLTAAGHLLVRTNERNEPVWFEADVDVHLSRDFELRGDTLWWDVPADQAQLQGSCRMSFTGAVMSFERAEFAPRARTFKILRSTVSADG